MERPLRTLTGGIAYPGRTRHTRSCSSTTRHAARAPATASRSVRRAPGSAMKWRQSAARLARSDAASVLATGAGGG